MHFSKLESVTTEKMGPWIMFTQKSRKITVRMFYQFYQLTCLRSIFQVCYGTLGRESYQ